METFWFCDQFVNPKFSLSTLSKNAKESIEKILSFWTTYSGQKILFELNNEIEIPEARCFFGFQINNQINHRELFSKLLNDVQYRHVNDSKSVKVKELFESEGFGEKLVIYSAMQSILVSSVSIVRFLINRCPENHEFVKMFDAYLNDKADYAKFGAVLFTHVVSFIN